jgi:hypothetical protein
MVAIILGPVLFYVPKFFELRTVHSRLGIDVTVDCSTILNPPKINFTAFKGMLTFKTKKKEILQYHLFGKITPHNIPSRPSLFRIVWNHSRRVFEQTLV